MTQLTANFLLLLLRREARMRASTGATSDVTDEMTTPVFSSRSEKDACDSAHVRPECSRSRVPPVCPRPLPDIIGTFMPGKDVIRGASKAHFISYATRRVLVGVYNASCVWILRNCARFCHCARQSCSLRGRHALKYTDIGRRLCGSHPPTISAVKRIDESIYLHIAQLLSVPLSPDGL